MGSTLIGTVKEFEDDNDDWVEYMERVEHFFLANDIDDDNKKKGDRATFYFVDITQLLWCKDIQVVQ